MVIRLGIKIVVNAVNAAEIACSSEAPAAQVQMPARRAPMIANSAIATRPSRRIVISERPRSGVGSMLFCTINFAFVCRMRS